MAVVLPAQTAVSLERDPRCERHDVSDGVVRVSLRGDLDASSGSDVDRALRAACGDVAFVVVDLDDVASVDGAGADVLRAAGAAARRKGRRIVAVNARPEVHRALALAGVEPGVKLIETPT
jgi:anti-anti-sigma factor